MIKPPKSPLEKPGTSRQRRPSGPRRTSSNEKTASQSSTSSKHGVKGSTGHASTADSSTKMTGSSSTDSKPPRPGVPGTPSNERDLPQENMAAGKGMPAGKPKASDSSTEVEGTEGELRKIDDVPEEVLKQIQTSSDEVDRLREAMNSQLSLSQQRERLVKHLNERDRQGSTSGQVGATSGNTSGKSKVSPIHEESTQSPSIEAALSSQNPELETTSTESARTIKGGLTPAAFAARTPSYPFPSMRTPKESGSGGHRPFTTLSPTIAPTSFFADSFQSPRDRWNASGTATPASTTNSQANAETLPSGGDPKYPSPNLYEWSLRLGAEPGLDAWWTTVVAMMRNEYKADRVTLAIPADATDVENVPWGQKATFSTIVEDELSVTYLPRGTGIVPSSGGDPNDMSSPEGVGFLDEDPTFVSGYQQQVRPGLQSRHSFTAYEDTKRIPTPREGNRPPSSRPALVSRSKSYFPGGPENAPRAETLRNAELNLKHLQEHLAFEDTQTHRARLRWDAVDVAKNDVRGRVFPVLQALDYEADPLIDSRGVTKVLDRGRLIALTRDYPYLNDPEMEVNTEQKSSPRVARKSKESESDKRKSRPGLSSRISSFIGGSSKESSRSSRSSRSQTADKAKLTAGSTNIQDPDEIPPESPKYEEYEQPPPSPWSQSPAPSPAVRTNSNENPFFANTEIDEDSFNPKSTQDYSSSQHVETIGVDRSYTVVHIPLDHILLSKPVQSFRLDTAALESKSSIRSKSYSQQKLTSTGMSAKDPVKEKRTPVAIFSILSPVIPYPSNLRHSLEHLAPHLATTFSLCRHYSDLENQVAGLSRKRPQVTGFGAVARPQDEHNFATNNNYFASESEPRQISAGSITSPSDYSGVSRSNAGSPSHTPGWDPSSVGLTVDRRSAGGSPAITGSLNDSYFGSRNRHSASRTDVTSTTVTAGGRRLSASKENSATESRHLHQSRYEKGHGQEHGRHGRERQEPLKAAGFSENVDPSPSVDEPPQTAKHGRIEQQPRPAASDSFPEARDPSPSRDDPLSPRRFALRGATAQITPPGEKIHTKLHSSGVDLGATYPSLPRSSAMNSPVEMLPPTDRLKTLMLDTLPAHVFVALPITGEMVWVNNPFLTYRGQTVTQMYEDPWVCLHPEEREAYLGSWAESVRTGQPFSTQVRIRRFDGKYRWFFARAVAGKDTKNVIQHWYGSYMDIHDQHVAEVSAARQEEKLNSEANYRLLANLIPQIIFAASEDKGVIFSNEQWMAYTGQSYEDALETGFMDYVHPSDLARCRIAVELPSTVGQPHDHQESDLVGFEASSTRNPSSTSVMTSHVSETPTDVTVKVDPRLSRTSSSSSGSKYELSSVDVAELARSGVIKVSTDSDGRQSYTTEVRLRSKTGEYRWHLVRCVGVDHIKFGNGEGSWFGACTDINDHKLLESKLKEAMESKSKFLSNMSHEIRTPLIGIHGMVEFLQQTDLDENQLDYTNTIATSATNLLAIINDILDLSKVDAGKMVLADTWFHPRSLIEDVNELVSTMAISKRLELNYVVEEDVPSVLKGDKIRIRQVLLNVIGNAIKFTNEGEVFSRCRVWKEQKVAPNQIMLEFSVIDTGNGFTKEEAELIFKPFSQIDGSSTRQHGGSGLGLVISRQLVELHGGEMTGSAIPGVGSTFRFTAKFGIATEVDRPPAIQRSTTQPGTSVSSEMAARALKSAGGNPILATKLLMSPPTKSPLADPNVESPAMASSASSAPSIRSTKTHITDRSSASSISASLAHFSEAARASGLDPLSMKLAIPPEKSPGSTPQPESTSSSQANSTSSAEFKHHRPPMYSILIICPQVHSREATTKHIEQTLPKDVPHQITPLASINESRALLSGDDPVRFTHIVLNLTTAREIIDLLAEIFSSISVPQTSVIILTDPQQRQEVMKLQPDYDYEQLAKENRLNFIFKPVKPSRFAFIFDPDRERDLSTDRNRSTTQQAVADQKQSYLEAEKRLGNKGYKVLLVEDNLVNRKVLLKFLGNVGLEVDIAVDGLECTDKVLSLPHGHFSLILCDLHMPRKDGYQACRDIRAWEKINKFSRMAIIALSANVMSEVQDKCKQAGFDDYVTKPVDPPELIDKMFKLIDPTGTSQITN